MIIKDTMMRKSIEQLLSYVHKDPEVNIGKAINMAKKLAPNAYVNQIKVIESIISDKNSPYYSFIFDNILKLQPEVLDKFIVNFLLKGNILTDKIRKEAKKKYNCNIPWTILVDPTTACNLKCKGCWAAEYGHSLNLSYEELDDLIRQAKEISIYFFIFTGGEPLVRKNDIIKLCEKHSDCDFLAFTNATLIDDAFVQDMLRIKNFVPAISIEGSEATTDGRRGEGVYKAVISAMDKLKAARLPFGTSCCYTSQNYEAITGEEFIDFMIQKGALFSWYFHFMPVGKSTGTELLPNPQQREHVYHQLRKFRSEKPLFILDFQNDSEYVGGCIAGGRNYLHINANGDVEPCVFIHYSDSNIREKTLIECLQSPLFTAYREGQPFNKNMLQPCPMLENPNLLREMVTKTGAKSTDILDKEDVEHLCGKCEHYAAAWKGKADEMWAETLRQKAAERAAKEAKAANER